MSLRPSFDHIKSTFEKEGYQLLSIAYKNNETPLSLMCPEGHSITMTWGNFNSHKKRCFVCFGKKTKTISEILPFIIETGWVYLDGEYTSNESKLNLRCPKGHIRSISWSNFKKGRRCRVCSNRDPETALAVLKVAIDARPGFKFIGPYEKAHIPVNMECPRGHAYSVASNDFKRDYDCPLCPKHTSRGQLEVVEWLKSILDVEIIVNDRSVLDSTELDIYIPSKKIAIEYNGVYWHAEGVSKNFTRYHLDEKVKESKAKDVRLFSIFSNEWHLRKDQVKGFLQSALGRNKKVHARKCEISSGVFKEVRNFLNTNHIQGTGKIDMAFQLSLDGVLVGVITAAKHHRGSKPGELVLNRLCFLSGVTVVGGASRLFNALKLKAASLGYTSILSWSDNRFSQGGIYKALNFECAEHLKPDYQYTLGNDMVPFRSKQACKKLALSKLGGSGDTELELATSLGLLRIWDAGKTRWRYNLSKTST